MRHEVLQLFFSSLAAAHSPSYRNKTKKGFFYTEKDHTCNWPARVRTHVPPPSDQQRPADVCFPLTSEQASTQRGGAVAPCDWDFQRVKYLQCAHRPVAPGAASGAD